MDTDSLIKTLVVTWKFNAEDAKFFNTLLTHRSCSKFIRFQNLAVVFH